MRTVVGSLGAAPSLGIFCLNDAAGGASFHAGSSSLPSSTGGTATLVALRWGAGGRETGAEDALPEGPGDGADAGTDTWPAAIRAASTSTASTGTPARSLAATRHTEPVIGMRCPQASLPWAGNMGNRGVAPPVRAAMVSSFHTACFFHNAMRS